ncbi:hypothetical protein [Cytobacillus praedii]|uniref:hypothetical protein n=1 Tax=Cytobacillus praedii TaxID=1742358 RepID=UPI0013F4306C|nr:hypothetical protein [Cytobacillus praedii]
MSEEQQRIKLNKEQTEKFLSFFVQDAKRIISERKREQRKAALEENRKEIS